MGYLDLRGSFIDDVALEILIAPENAICLAELYERLHVLHAFGEKAGVARVLFVAARREIVASLYFRAQSGTGTLAKAD